MRERGRLRCFCVLFMFTRMLRGASVWACFCGALMAAVIAFDVGYFGIAGHGVTYAAAMDGGVAKCSRIVTISHDDARR